jgi:hypothetical protein
MEKSDNYPKGEPVKRTAVPIEPAPSLMPSAVDRLNYEVLELRGKLEALETANRAALETIAKLERERYVLRKRIRRVEGREFTEFQARNPRAQITVVFPRWEK